MTWISWMKRSESSRLFRYFLIFNLFRLSAGTHQLTRLSLALNANSLLLNIPNVRTDALRPTNGRWFKNLYYQTRAQLWTDFLKAKTTPTKLSFYIQYLNKRFFFAGLKISETKNSSTKPVSDNHGFEQRVFHNFLTLSSY